MQREHPQLDVVGLGQDFSAGLELPADLLEGGAPLFFYPGSSIGNFTRDEALRLPAPDPRARRAAAAC